MFSSLSYRKWAPSWFLPRGSFVGWTCVKNSHSISQKMKVPGQYSLLSPSKNLTSKVSPFLYYFYPLYITGCSLLKNIFVHNLSRPFWLGTPFLVTCIYFLIYVVTLIWCSFVSHTMCAASFVKKRMCYFNF